LHIAAVGNKEHVVKLLLERGSLRNPKDKEGRTPLMRALEHGHEQTVKLLLNWSSMEETEDIESALATTDNNGKNALFYCLSPTDRHIQCLDMLVSTGADVNSEDASGLPLLCAACKEGYEKIVSKLLELGADPCAQHKTLGTSAVMYAAECGSSECIRLLSKAGADMNATDAKKETATHKAASKGLTTVLHTLAAFGADFNVSDAKGNTTLHCAVQAGDTEGCKFLTQRGCHPNDANDEEITPKKLADELGFKDIVKEVKKATTVAQKIEQGGKPKGYTELWRLRIFDWVVQHKLQCVAEFEKLDTEEEGTLPTDTFIAALRNLGIPVEDKDIRQVAALHDKGKKDKVNYEEFLRGSKYVTKQYAAYAAEPKEKGKKKKGGKRGKKGKFKIPFPIIYSTEGEKPVNCTLPEVMIEKHHHVCDEGRFPRDAPPGHLLQDDSLWYLNQPERTYVNIFDAVLHGDIESIKLAVNRGTSVNVRDRFQKTLLMEACCHGRIDIIEYLLANRSVMLMW
jgi:ankyrin repeat protein